MLSTLSAAAAVVVAGVSGAAAAAEPKPPTLTFLYSINITMGASLDVGTTSEGSRGILPIAGGAFAGPKLAGNVSAGIDWGLTDGKGNFSPDAVYVLATDDGAHIMVRERGHAPNVNLIFSTGSAKYAWLDQAVGYASGAPTKDGVALDVWQISAPS